MLNLVFHSKVVEEFGVSLKRFGGSLKMCVEFGISVKSGVSFNIFGKVMLFCTTNNRFV